MEKSGSATGSSKEVGFKNYERNEAFPIHANIYDSEVDKNSTRPGGFFSKKLYEGSVEDVAQKKEEPAVVPKGKHGGRDAGYAGFCRTGPMYRAHYKIARQRQQMRTVDGLKEINTEGSENESKVRDSSAEDL